MVWAGGRCFLVAQTTREVAFGWRNAPGLLLKEAVTVRPPLGEREHSIFRSYLAMRAAIGALGILLPVVLLLGDRWILKGSASARGSLSAYYHSGMRDYFVATLVVVGFLLILYKIFERSQDNTLSTVAGVAAILVAFFPTELSGDGVLTPLQDRIGEETCEIIHYAAASVLFAVLARLSWLFGEREGKRGERPKLVRGPHPSATGRRVFHQASALIVTVAVLFILLTRWVDLFGDWDLLIGESVAIIAFGLSLAYKGAELDMLVPSMARRSA